MPKEKLPQYSHVSVEISIHLRYLHQDLGLPLREVQKRYPKLSKTSIYRHMKKAIGASSKDGRKKNKGRPPKLTDRDVRHIEASLQKLREDIGDLFSTDVQRDCNVTKVSNRTVRRSLAKKGYKFSQCRKKGQLTKEDCTKRLHFARRCKKIPEKLWTEGISFYLDGTGWVHKTNPSMNTRTSRTRTWKKKGESLSRHCTAKGKKEGVGGKMAKFIVAISHGKGVIACEQYTGHMDGEMFSEIIKEHFHDMFLNSANSVRKLFLQGGDPAQNSALARETWESLGYSMFYIPARSRDLNPIGNTFHLSGKKLKKEAKDFKLEKETYQQFCARAKATTLEFSSTIIDRTIESMARRIKAVIEAKGMRTKY